MNRLQELRKLLVAKKKNIVSEEEKKKIKVVENLLKREDVFFNIKIDLALGILNFLGIPEDKMKEYYTDLISPENYFETVSPYFSVSPRK